MPSPDGSVSPKAFAILVRKEWRDLLAGRAFWALLLLLSPLVGYGYVQALALYGEASRSAAGLPEVARNLSPLDGILVPTFGGLYLVTTFLFPFVVIRTIGNEKQTGSLKLLLQLPCSLPTVLAAKLSVISIAWLLMVAPCLSVVVLWSSAGGHVGGGELGNLILGHFLYGAVIAGIALLAAALAESNATAAILTLAITLGFWVLDFAAAGEGGLLKTLSGLSLTTLLRDFERGIFSLGAVFGAAGVAGALCILSGVWVDLKARPAHKLALTFLVLFGTAAALVGASHLHLYADATENRRNSFEAADATTLSRLDKRLAILVHLAPEDPRYIDFERNILGKLRRTMPDVEIRLQSEGRSGLFEGQSETYGIVRYRYGGKEDISRSTGAGEVLPLIYALAGVHREVIAATPVYPGYPLQADARSAQVWFYGVLPLLVLALWSLAQGIIPVGGRAHHKAPFNHARPRVRDQPHGER